jgi:hypothetical protein
MIHGKTPTRNNGVWGTRLRVRANHLGHAPVWGT